MYPTDLERRHYLSLLYLLLLPPWALLALGGQNAAVGSGPAVER